MGKAVYTGKGRGVDVRMAGWGVGWVVAERLATVLHTVAEFTVWLLCKNVSALQLQTPKERKVSSVINKAVLSSFSSTSAEIMSRES